MLIHSSMVHDGSVIKYTSVLDWSTGFLTVCRFFFFISSSEESDGKGETKDEKGEFMSTSIVSDILDAHVYMC